MKYRFSFRMVIIWLFIMLAAGLYLIILAPREAVPSDDENRMLAAFPEASFRSVRSGEFSKGLESFLSDKLPARDSLAAASQSVMDMFSVLTEDEINDNSREAFLQELLAEGETSVSGSDSTGISEQDDNTGTDTDDRSVTDGQPEPGENAGSAGVTAVNGGTLVPTPVESYGYEGYEQDESVLSRDTGIEYGILTENDAPDLLSVSIARENTTNIELYSESKSGAREAVEIYNRLAALVDGTVNVLIPPESAYVINFFDNREKYKCLESDIEKYMRSLAADNLIIYSAADILSEVPAGEYLYFYSDHHWTPEGCYYAYREMMRRQGIIPVSWEDHAVTSTKFYGSYFDKREPLKYRKDRIDIITPLTENKLYIINGRDRLSGWELVSQGGFSYATAYFPGTVEPWAVVESRCNIGRKCLVLMDSFGKPMLPFLANHYDEQFVCDLRHYKPEKGGGRLSEIIDTYGIDDVYIIIMPIYVFGAYTMTNMNSYI